MTLQRSNQVYDDAQFQNSDPVGPQIAVPLGFQDMELSWDRKAGYMRIIIEGYTWHFKEYLGKARIVHTNNKDGRIHIYAKAQIEGDTMTMWRDKEAPLHPIVEGDIRPDTFNRLCYRRWEINNTPAQEWRLRDERLTLEKGWDAEGALVLVKGYVGDLNAEWNKNDSVAHIFHQGWTIVDKDRIAHLYDRDLTY
jgi:hypothetical protein